MQEKTLFIIFTFLFYYIPAFSQHPYYRGENPLFWAVAGGIGAVIVFIFYLGISFLKKHLHKRNDTVNNNAKEIEDKINSTIEINTKKLPRTKSEKHKIYFAISYILALLIAISSIEIYIYNKKENLYKSLSRAIRLTFENTVGGDNVQALHSNYIDQLKYAETQIPPFPKNGFEWDQKYWENMFSGIEHVYTIRGWAMEGMVRGIFPGEEGGAQTGIINYFYFPYMICVPKGVEFNQQIAEKVLSASLDKVYREPEKYEAVNETKGFSNDYFHIIGHNTGDYFPFVQDKKTGSEHIIENNKPTKYYWFGMINIGPYRVLLAYDNDITWNIAEKDGFNASLKDRTILYSITIILLTSIYIIVRRRINKKLNRKKLIVSEPLRNRLIRLSNPLNFVNSTNPLDVSNASSINERLLEKPLGEKEEILIANEFKEKLGINLISTKEKEYLIEIGAGFLKKNKKKLNNDITKLVNHLYVLISDINQIDGKTYCEIQKTIGELSRS